MESKLKLPLSGVVYNKNGGYISIQQLVRSNVTFFLDGGGGEGWGARGNVNCEPGFIVCYHYLVNATSAHNLEYSVRNVYRPYI